MSTFIQLIFFDSSSEIKSPKKFDTYVKLPPPLGCLYIKYTTINAVE